MISEEKIRQTIKEVMAGLSGENNNGTPADEPAGAPTLAAAVANTSGEKAMADQNTAVADDLVTDDAFPDLTALDLRQELWVPDAVNPELYRQLKKATPARVGIWRSGPRPLTRALLRFRADHAVAQDAVFSDVGDAFLESMDLTTVQSQCRDKDEFLTRPDLGRRLSDEAKATLKELYKPGEKVLIFMADGLSSTAIETNASDTLKSIVQGLAAYNITPPPPFFLKYGRVPSMDEVGELLTPEAIVLLVGERPGLATGESMSCYMAYKASTTMPEANRTVISNIHKSGTPAVEAGAHIAEVVKKILDQKASGLNLKE